MRRFLCFTLEDEGRTRKVKGETRVPAGTYELKLRTVGGFHEKYKAQFGAMHQGMLWLQNVPNFEFVLIHMGNTDADTAGCLLVGNTATQNATGRGVVGESRAAYRRIYPPIAAALAAGQKVHIEIIDRA